MNDFCFRYTLRINRGLFAKFRYIAAYNGRSANREMEWYIKQCAQRFEKEHGEITAEDVLALS